MYPAIVVDVEYNVESRRNCSDKYKGDWGVRGMLGGGGGGGGGALLSPSKQVQFQIDFHRIPRIDTCSLAIPPPLHTLFLPLPRCVISSQSLTPWYCLLPNKAVSPPSTPTPIQSDRSAPPPRPSWSSQMLSPQLACICASQAPSFCSTDRIHNRHS